MDGQARVGGVTDFLLELLSEEIPARMQEKASADLARLFAAELAKWELTADAIDTYVTPRRLALIARNIPEAISTVRREFKGPPADAPAAAIDGFLRKLGLGRDVLEERADAKGRATLFAVINVVGRRTAELLPSIVESVIRAFPWPKAMRWGAASASTDSLRWVRPLQGIVALLGETAVLVEIAGVASGAATVGHRFHHPGIITIGSAADYAEKLRACHVIVDAEERRAIVRRGAEAAARAAGLALVPDEALVAENAGLTEWPVPLLGKFDPEFLTVPREVIQLTMRTNQKYFACTDAGGALAPAFVCTANIVASDGGAAIVAGNAKVLAARLADARFFWEQDLKVPLAERAKKLSDIVFHEKLGTVADKVERVAKLARWLVEEGIVGSLSGVSADRTTLADMAEQAARLAKADLVTGMVGEFPELQGIMGGYYARAEGRPEAVADAIRDHYKPVGQGDEVPTAPVTVAVSLADKLDTLAAFFWEGMLPTGSKDPFALRRAALSASRQILESNVRLRLGIATMYALARYAGRRIGDRIGDQFDLVADAHERTGRNLTVSDANKLRDELFDSPEASEELFWKRALLTSVTLLDFFADRLKVQQREAGVRHDLIDAVFALGGEDDLVRLLARVKALQKFVETDEGANLLAGYRRAANILRAEAKKDAEALPPFDGFKGYEPDPAEAALAAALDTQLPFAEAAIADERFEDAMTALSVLRPAIDRFFDDVTVNSQDGTERQTRLALLENLRAAMHNVADFSRIEG